MQIAFHVQHGRGVTCTWRVGEAGGAAGQRAAGVPSACVAWHICVCSLKATMHVQLRTCIWPDRQVRSTTAEGHRAARVHLHQAASPDMPHVLYTACMHCSGSLHDAAWRGCGISSKPQRAHPCCGARQHQARNAHD